MKNFVQMMKQVQGMQEKMKEMQAGLDRLEVEGAAGGGMVRVTMSGKGEARAVSVDEALLKAEEKAVLEDLIVAAFNDARRKVDAKVKEMTAELTGGLQLPPGLNLPFG